MKLKTKIIILVSVCLVGLVGVLIADKIMTRTYLNEIKYDEVIEMIKNKDDFILLVSQTTCSHCANFKPKLEKVANEYKIKMYYIQVDLLSDDESQMLDEYINYSGSTPETIFIKDGTERTAASRIRGDSSISTIKMKLKANGWINE